MVTADEDEAATGLLAAAADEEDDEGCCWGDCEGAGSGNGGGVCSENAS